MNFTTMKRNVPDTKEVRALEFMKRFQPKMYKAMVLTRPDIIRAAYARPLNGLGDVSGILDDILDFGSKSLNLYKDQQIFKTQIQQATAKPVQVIQAAPAASVAPAVAQPISPTFDAATEQRLKTSNMMRYIIPGVAVAAILGLVYVFKGRKK